MFGGLEFDKRKMRPKKSTKIKMLLWGSFSSRRFLTRNDERQKALEAIQQDLFGGRLCDRPIFVHGPCLFKFILNLLTLINVILICFWIEELAGVGDSPNLFLRSLKSVKSITSNRNSMKFPLPVPHSTC